MRRRAVLSLIGSCILAACAHQQAPVAMAGMAWSLSSSEGEGAKLAFGQPQSDNVIVMLSCQPKSGAVLVSLNAPADAEPSLVLTSRDKSARYRGAVSPGLDGGAVIEATAGASDQVLVSFGATGDLAVAVNGRRTALPGDRAQAGRFMASCRA